MKARPSITKRQRERAKAERRSLKAARRAQRKANNAQEPEEVELTDPMDVLSAQLLDAGVDPDTVAEVVAKERKKREQEEKERLEKEAAEMKALEAEIAAEEASKA